LSDFEVSVTPTSQGVIYPNIAGAGIESPEANPGTRELDTAEVSLSNGGLRLNDWFERDHRKQQSDERQNRLRIQVDAHCVPPINGNDNTQQTSMIERYTIKFGPALGNLSQEVQRVRRAAE
jgi:hypothetical protein